MQQPFKNGFLTGIVQMKIVHVISGLTKGGGERVVAELANEAVKKGCTVTVLAGWPEDTVLLQDTLHKNVEVRFIAKTKKLAYLKIPFWILRNKRWITGFDVLHCHLTFGSLFGTVAFILLKSMGRSKKPVITETNHAVGMPVPAVKRWWHSRMLLYRDGNIFMATDPYWAAFCKTHNRIPAKFIANGISFLAVNNVNEVRQKLFEKTNIPADCKWIIGTVGMLRADRKPDLYVYLFKEIQKRTGNSVHFILGGSGEEYGKIEELVTSGGIRDNFHMLGLVERPAEVIAVLDLYVSVSVGQTAGISMLEAALGNVPVIAVQLTEGYKTTGSDWFWSDNDLHLVAEKIVDLLANDEQRKNLSGKQNAYVRQHFTSEGMFTAYCAFYDELTK